MSDWREWRKRQRAELVARREAVTAENHRRWSAAITVALEQGFPALGQGAVVGFYWPHRGEYDPCPAVDFFRRRGAILALPEVENNHKPLHFRKWWPGAPMRVGAYNIPVPDDTERVAIDAVLAPMIGFDRLGYRLGYGSGYFDRTLALARPQPLAIGVAFELLRLDSIHPQPHDIAMDFIVTEAGIYRVDASGLVLVSPAECAAQDVLEKRRAG